MPKSILIVDDDPSTVELLKFTLEEAGYKALAANTGEEALEKIKKHKPDLVLLDIMLPMKDGYSVLEELRGTQAFKILPIVIISAKVQEVDISFGLELGANDYFTKPLDLPGLVQRVSDLTAQKDEQ
jgi:DNA-binding response OmpR family regulator